MTLVARITIKLYPLVLSFHSKIYCKLIQLKLKENIYFISFYFSFCSLGFVYNSLTWGISYLFCAKKTNAIINQGFGIF